MVPFWRILVARRFGSVCSADRSTCNPTQAAARPILHGRVTPRTNHLTPITEPDDIR
jgi:hypothetical protein